MQVGDIIGNPIEHMQPLGSTDVRRKLELDFLRQINWTSGGQPICPSRYDPCTN